MIIAMLWFKRRPKIEHVLPTKGKEILYLLSYFHQHLSNIGNSKSVREEIVHKAFAGDQDDPHIIPICIYPVGPEWTRPLFEFDDREEDEEVRFFIGKTIARVQPTKLLLDWIEEEGLGITWEHSKNCNYCVNLHFASDTDIIYFKMRWQD